jgi:hypothetical protein
VELSRYSGLLNGIFIRLISTWQGDYLKSPASDHRVANDITAM